jgi:hypothetical protein
LRGDCEKLEAKCNKLEHMLETKTNSIKEHVDSKFDRQHEYNSMLVKNQSWKYSTPVYSEVHWENNGYDADVARYLTESSDCLKELTEKMRQGEFPSDYSDGRKGINLDWDEGDPNSTLLPSVKCVRTGESLSMPSSSLLLRSTQYLMAVRLILFSKTSSWTDMYQDC